METYVETKMTEEEKQEISELCCPGIENFEIFRKLLKIKGVIK